MKPRLFVYGAGGFGREVAWLAEELGYKVEAFLDDNSARWGQSLNGIPVLSLEQAEERYATEVTVSVAIGNPQVRRAVVAKLEQRGFRFATLVHPRVEKSAFVEIGEGTIITAGNILTVNIRLGRHVHINLDCTIGHDAILEDFVTLAPGVHISGWVFVREGAYLGTGAVVINGTQETPTPT